MVSLAAAIEYDKRHFAGLDLNAKPSLAFDIGLNINKLLKISGAFDLLPGLVV